MIKVDVVAFKTLFNLRLRKMRRTARRTDSRLDGWSVRRRHKPLGGPIDLSSKRRIFIQLDFLWMTFRAIVRGAPALYVCLCGRESEAFAAFTTAHTYRQSDMCVQGRDYIGVFVHCNIPVLSYQPPPRMLSTLIAMCLIPPFHLWQSVCVCV